MKKLLFFSEEMTPRLHYAATFFFEKLLGLELAWTNDRTEFQRSIFIKINYSESTVSDNELQVFPYKLLFETDTKPQPVTMNEWHGLPIFFENDQFNSAVPFDFLAASFWLMTRYEEYLPFKKDNHGRFAATESLAYKKGFIEMPVIDLWAIEIGKLLTDKFPEIRLLKREFQFQLTYDIDYAYAYLNKGFLRNTGGFLRDLLKLKLKNCWQRIVVGLGFKIDPFDTFDYQKSLHGTQKLAPVYFFHVGNYTGEPDAPIGFEEPEFRKLVENLSKDYKIGIHPSYRSFNKSDILDTEKKRLEEIVNKPIKYSRQHFLLLRFPTTYRTLIENGIEHDWTLGYADAIGFRASVAEDFYWFDLLKNEKTDLLIHPFQIMDVTLNNYLQISSEKAIKISKKLIENTKAVGGRITVLWHNNSLSEAGQWKGWRDVFEQIAENGH